MGNGTTNDPAATGSQPQAANSSSGSTTNHAAYHFRPTFPRMDEGKSVGPDGRRDPARDPNGACRSATPSLAGNHFLSLEAPQIGSSIGPRPIIIKPFRRQTVDPPTASWPGSLHLAIDPSDAHWEHDVTLGRGPNGGVVENNRWWCDLGHKFSNFGSPHFPSERSPVAPSSPTDRIRRNGGRIIFRR